MLVGRDAELTEVGQVVHRRGAVALVGPAGVGKTALARAALDAAGPWREAAALAALRWSSLLPFRRLLRRDPPDDPESVAYEVLAEGDAPVLIEDLQWADDASLTVLAHLIGRLPVLVTVRSGDESDRVLGLLDLVGVPTRALAPLDRRAAVALADRLHPGLGESARDDLVARAGGSPLLLEQLPLGGSASPRLVTALLDRRAELSDAGRAALDRLAVLGRPAPDHLLGPGADELDAAAFARSGPEGREIAHSLLAEVVADELGARADAIRVELAEQVDDPEAAHLLAAAGQRERARAVALRAAKGASRREQADLLRLAVACSDDLDVDNRIRAARLFTSLSDPTTARSLAAVPGRDALPAVERGALLAAESEAAWLAGDQRAAMALCADALVALDGTRTRWEVAVLAGSTVAATFIDVDGRPALDRARQAVALADELGVEQGYARSRLASVLLTSGLPGWQELLEEAIERSQAGDDDDTRRTAVVSMVLGCWGTGDLDRGLAVAEAELDRGPRQHFDVTWLTISSYAAMLRLLRGDDRTAIARATRPLLDAWPRFRSRPFMAAAEALAIADAGHQADALRRTEAAMADASLEPQWRSISGWAHCEALWLAGRPDAAVAAHEDVAGLGVGDYPAAIQARLIAGHAQRELGAPPPGPRPTSLLAAWAPAGPEHDALVAFAAGDLDASVDAFLDAAAGWARGDVRSEVRCRWAAGDVAAAAGRADAAALLVAADERAGRLGLVALQDRIRRSLRAAGIDRRRPSRRGVAGLTAREQQVLLAVGRGQRTAEIAAALGVTASTVDSSIRSGRRKLGAATRVEAAARLQQLIDERAAPSTD